MEIDVRLTFAVLILSAPGIALAQPVVSDPYGLAVPEIFSLDLSIGKEVTVSAGDAAVSTRRYRPAQGAILDGPATPPANSGLMFAMPTGTMVYSVKTKRAFKGCSVELYGQSWPPCLIDDDGDGTFDRIAMNDMAGAKPLVAKVPYTRRMVEVPPASQGFKRTVLYQGSSPDGLKFSYREFSNDWARPAFEEQLSIPVTSFPQQFAVKGLVFTAQKVGPMGITLRLDSVDPAKGWPAP